MSNKLRVKKYLEATITAKTTLYIIKENKHRQDPINSISPTEAGQTLGRGSSKATSSWKEYGAQK